MLKERDTDIQQKMKQRKRSESDEQKLDSEIKEDSNGKPQLTNNATEGPSPSQESIWRNVPFIGPCVKLYDKYDSTFLTMLGMQYFNQGTKVLVYLASSDLFKAYYHLEPGTV